MSPATPPPALSDREVLETALRWAGEGRGVAIATVVRTWGSAPRPTGAQCAVSESLEIVGSVSGGCVESAVIDAAPEVIASGEPRMLGFEVADEEAWSVGLACGGRIGILLEPVSRTGGGFPLSVLEGLSEAIARGRGAVVATDLDSGAHELLFPLESDAPAGPGAALQAAAVEALRSDRSGQPDRDGLGATFLRVYNPEHRLIIVGAVHIAQHLAIMAKAAGFETLIVDPRPVFASETRFPGVPIVSQWPDEALTEARIDHRTAIVVLSHDPKLDDPALSAALASPAFYVGALGSQRTHEKRRARLADEGISPERIARIDAPVGLDIGARTPGEIAVAIIAKVVEVLRHTPEAAGAPA